MERNKMNQKSAAILGVLILISALLISATIVFRKESGRYQLTHKPQNDLVVMDMASGRIWFYSSQDGKWKESAQRPWLNDKR
jgi:hypothetical protein